MPSVAGAKKSAKKSSKVSKPVKKSVETTPTKSYKELITEGLVALEDRKGTSRPALKKFIKEQYPKIGSSTTFDLHFNNAVKKGVESGDFEQPKGTSGPLKLVKKVKEKLVAKKSASPPSKKVTKKTVSPVIPNLSYKEMITQAIMELNHGKGSSRLALKKYVKDHNPSTTNSNFDHLFNTALKKGVGLGDFAQPKGPSGVVKINPKIKHKILAQKKAV